MKVKFHTTTASQLKICGQYNLILLASLSKLEGIAEHCTLFIQQISFWQSNQGIFLFPVDTTTTDYSPVNTMMLLQRCWDVATRHCSDVTIQLRQKHRTTLQKRRHCNASLRNVIMRCCNHFIFATSSDFAAMLQRWCCVYWRAKIDNEIVLFSVHLIPKLFDN